MPRVKTAAAESEPVSVDVEIERLRDLDVDGLRARWEAAHGKKAPTHLPRHLLLRILAYRLQAERLGDLDSESERILDRSDSPEQASKRAADASRSINSLRPGTVLGREWSGQMHRVAVLADGFAWNGTTYQSLSRVAFAITGTRWNGLGSLGSARGLYQRVRTHDGQEGASCQMCDLHPRLHRSGPRSGVQFA